MIPFTGFQHLFLLSIQLTVYCFWGEGEGYEGGKKTTKPALQS